MGRLYFVDIVQNGIYRSPAHFGGRVVAADAVLADVVGFYCDYGQINQCLIYARDISPVHEDYLDALPDVLAIPADLDTVITAGQCVG